MDHEIFELRYSVYTFLARCLREEPDASLIDNLLDGEILLNFPSWVENDKIEDAYQYANSLTKYLAAKSPADVLAELENVYEELFLGPGKLMAPPWESVYLNYDGLTFGPQTLDVREYYARHGLAIRKIHREPDDHIAYELEFYARLCAEMRAALVEQDLEKSRYLLSEMKGFLDEHLMLWIDLLAEKVVNHDSSGFYSWVISMTTGLLEGDRLMLEQALLEGRTQPR